MRPVLVIGGGVFGASFAFELAARGRRVVLVDRAEFAAGTSANSMKTIHGGIRHLARLDIAQVVESIKARAHVASLFPDLVRPLRFVAPAMSVIENGVTHRAAATLYNVLCHLFDGTDALQNSPATMLRPADYPELFRHLNVSVGTSALCWTDLQVVDSELLVRRLIRAAEQAGAFARDHSEIVGIEPCGSCYRITIRCPGTNHAYVEEFSDVFDCSGDARVAERCLDQVDPEVEFVTACNLVLKRNLCEHATGIPLAGSKNLLFTVPWQSSTIVGTWYFDDSQNRRSREELSSICLDDARRFLPHPPSLDDVTDFHLGRLPARRAAGGASAQSRLLRRCGLLELHDNSPTSRLFVVRGTKYTNAPRFARRMLDRLFGAAREAYVSLPAK